MHDLAAKHLDYLQAVITRMAANSFLARGWSLTLTVALIGLATDRGRPALALLALFPITAFWLFDAYFLALEKRFRDLFDTAARAALNGGETTLSMNPGAITIPFVLRCATRPVMLLSHGTILACDLCLLAILCAVG